MGVVDMILAAPPLLTARQCEMLQAAADGERAKQTAARLYLSLETVKWHRQEITKTLGARSIDHAVAVAYRQGLIR